MRWLLGLVLLMVAALLGMVAGLVLMGGTASAEPMQEMWHPYRFYQGRAIEQGQVSCGAASGTLLAASYARVSVMFRNLGAGDVYICRTVDLAEGALPGTCTTASAGLFLGGTTKDAVTLDQATFGVGWSCITSSGTGTVAYYVER